jgi:ABC-2 type transport system permease protein
MKSMLALVRREYLEHRAAFLYVPVGILVVLTVTLLLAVVLHREPPPIEVSGHSLLQFYQVSLFGMAALWFLYLLAALFFSKSL